MEKKTKSIVDETIDLFKTYSEKRETWAQHVQEDREFRFGKQWTKEQTDKLLARGQAPIVVNRIHPAVESAKALITTNRPSFRVSPREDSDNQTAQAINGLLEYIWQISDGGARLRTIVDDYYVAGLGWMLVYQDPMADMGKGEVKLRDVDPLDVYPDPNARERNLDDAENIIISRLFTKKQAIRMEPMYSKKIKKASSDQDSDRPVTEGVDGGATSWPEETNTTTNITFGDGDEYVRGYERYNKFLTEQYRVFEKFSGLEDLLEKKAMAEYMKKPAWVINGQVIAEPTKAKNMINQLMQQYQQSIMQYQQMAMQAQQYGQQPQQPPEKPQIQQITYKELIDQDQIDIIEIPIWRIKQTVVMGDKLLYQRVMPTEFYPIVAFMNLHTRTPFPVSDVRMVKDLQKYINKIRSLIIAHATTSTNTKILVPEGSVDMTDFEEKWAQPGVAIQYDPTDGPPVPIQPLPMPNELYKNELDAKADIDHELGLYEMMMGNTAAAPDTYKATISLDEFGQRKIRSKLADIESGLRRAGQVAISLMQQLYTTQKIIQLIQPNSSMTEYAINKGLYDDKSNVIDTLNNITKGKYDVIVVSGSTLPTNRYAQLEVYMNAYEKGIIDRVEVLKKTEVFDMEGVLQRTDENTQLKQQLQEIQENVKDLQGDLQTRERDIFHTKQQLEVEKFKNTLGKISNKAQAAETVYSQRLSDSQRDVDKEVNQQEQTTRKLKSEEESLQKQLKNLKRDKPSKESPKE